MADTAPAGHAPVVAVSYLDAVDQEQLFATTRALLARVTGASESNPLGTLVGPGQTVVVKPNMVRHFNPAGPLSAVITSPQLVRVLVTVAFEAVGPSGQVIVADSPQNDCDFSALLADPAWREVLEWANEALGSAFQILDMRPEAVTVRQGIIVDRQRLNGDPLGETIIDLGSKSAFSGSNIDAGRLRGSEYDPAVTHSSHTSGLHQYSVCRTFLNADLLIVVPKVKTHKKVGLSLAMKNLVGMVGEKNCLPHYTAGFPHDGGDEYQDRALWPTVRQWSVERARRLLAKGRGVRIFQLLRRLERAAMPEVVSRSGNWWGNDTAWRMVIDLVTILRMSRLDRGLPTLFVYDGQIAGEGDGPLAPSPVLLGLLAVAADPVAGDVAVARELGVSVESMPLLREAATRACWGDSGSANPLVETLRQPNVSPTFHLHPGWIRVREQITSK